MLYNELNPLLVDTIRRAINGDFNLDTFKPEFITFDKFHELKDTDGYIKYFWSFGVDGKTYYLTKRLESIAAEGYNYAVFGTPIEGLSLRTDGTIRQRRIWLKRKTRFEYLKRLHPLERLERAERLENLKGKNITINCGSYTDYEYREGDVVYCDIPYEDTKNYSRESFDHAAFYDWAASRPYQVFFSSYSNISDKRFKMVWAKPKRALMSGSSIVKYNYECIYTNKVE